MQTPQITIFSESERCKYNGCYEKINAPYHDSLCVFHCPYNSKGMEEVKFNKLIEDKVLDGKLDFRGYIFPWRISFNLFSHELSNVNFSFGQFLDSIEFTGIIFSGANFFNTIFYNFVNFTKCTFRDKNQEFHRTRFLGGLYCDDAKFETEVVFRDVRIKGERCTFRNVKFNDRVRLLNSCISTTGEIAFSSAYFARSFTIASSTLLASPIDFEKTVFMTEFTLIDIKTAVSQVRFKETYFKGNATFHVSHFKGGVNFWGCKFDGDLVQFSSLSISRESSIANCTFIGKLKMQLNLRAGLRFSEPTFSRDAFFEFSGPMVLSEPKTPFSVIFQNVIFNAERTNFVGVHGEVQDIMKLVFENCSMVGVRFTGCNLRAIRFDYTPLGEIIFSACTWPFLYEKIFFFFRHKRENVLGEEAYLDEESKKYANTYEKLAPQYRQMKAALDAQHDYDNAGHFYYNKYEMERKACALKASPGVFHALNHRLFRTGIQGMGRRAVPLFLKESGNALIARIKWVFYTGYKIVAGYGERPQWSAIWLGILLILMISINLKMGFFIHQTSNKHAADALVKYNWGIDVSSIADLPSDILSSTLYTIEHIPLFHQIMGSEGIYFPKDEWSIIVNLTGGLGLLLLLGFFVVGLQRMFKRF